MAFVSVADTVRLAIKFQSSDGNEAVNVLHFYDGLGRGDSAALTVLVNIVAGWLASDWNSTASSTWAAREIEARYLNTEDDVYLVEPINIDGLGSDQALPAQNTIAISLRSGFTGRSRRGRLYHVGLGEGAVTGDYLIGTARTAFITAYEGLLSAAAVDDFYWSIVSYVENGAPRVTPLVTAITQITITDDIVDSMDKRKPRP